MRPAAPRFDTIDLLRGFSILGVVLVHASLWLSYGNFKVGASFPGWLHYVVFRQGRNDVSAFFAISGFLITFLSIRRFGTLAELHVGTFYRIRFARIFPLLACLLVVLSLCHWAGPSYLRITPNSGSLWQALFAALTFHLNWFEAVHGFLPAPWTVLWSLSVEEMFYLFFPLICVGLLRQRWTRPLFFVVLFGFVCFGPFARTSWYSSNGIWLYQSYLGNVDNVALGCLFGLLTAHLNQTGYFARSRWPVYWQLLGTILTAFIVVWDWPSRIFSLHIQRAIDRSGVDMTILGLGVCLIMLGGVLRNAKGRPWTAPLRWIGRYSYEIYLSHEFAVMGVLSLFLSLRRGPVGFWVLGTVVLSSALGYVLSRFVSEPANRLLRGAPVPAELQATEKAH